MECRRYGCERTLMQVILQSNFVSIETKLLQEREKNGHCMTYLIFSIVVIRILHIWNKLLLFFIICFMECPTLPIAQVD